MIKNYIKKFSDFAPMLSIIMYVSIMLLTFDNFSYDTITTESPLFVIAAQPFYRFQFVTIVFCLSACVGRMISVFIKKFSKVILPIAYGVLGLLTLIIALFSVDFLQQLTPTTRISHVVMTVSQIISIAMGASGLFVGVIIGCLDFSKVKLNSLIFTILIATAVTVFSISEKTYLAAYVAMAVMLLIVSFLVEIFPNNEIKLQLSKYVPHFDTNSILMLVVNSLTIVVSSIFMFSSANYLLVNLQFAHSSYLVLIGIMATMAACGFFVGCGKELKYIRLAAMPIMAICGIVLALTTYTEVIITANVVLAFAIGVSMQKFEASKKGNQFKGVTYSVAVLFGAIIAYVFLHMLGTKIPYSGNRVVFIMGAEFYWWVVALGVLGAIIELAKLYLVRVFRGAQKSIRRA